MKRLVGGEQQQSAPGRADVVALTRAVDVARARDNEAMIVRADVAGRTADRVSFGSSAIVDARGTILRTGQALREDILVAEIHTGLANRTALSKLGLSLPSDLAAQVNEWID